MKKLFVFLMVLGLIVLGTGLALAQVHLPVTTKVYQAPVAFDETLPRVVTDAPSGFGSYAWQGPENPGGIKTNYYADLSTLFPSNTSGLWLSDLASISYFSKGAPDWHLLIYTPKEASGNHGSWYADVFYGASGATSTDWALNTYGGSSDLWVTSSGAQYEANFDSTLVNLGQTQNQKILAISLHTYKTDIDSPSGYLDGLTITLTNGDQGVVDFTSVPEPATMLLLGLGLVGLAGARRKFKK